MLATASRTHLPATETAVQPAAAPPPARPLAQRTNVQGPPAMRFGGGPEPSAIISFVMQILGLTWPRIRQKEQRLDQALTEALAAVNRYAGRRVGVIVLRPLLATIRLRHRLTSLEAVARGRRWAVRGVVNPAAERPTPVEVGVEVGDESYTATLLGDQIVTVANDNTGQIITFPPGLSLTAQVEALRRGFNLSGGTAQGSAILNKINRAGQSRPLPGNMLLSFARRSPDPEAFLAQRLEAGTNPMDAVAGPVPRAIRDRLVNLGTDEPGEEGRQRQSLSPWALVFVEDYRGQLNQKTSGSVQFKRSSNMKKSLRPQVSMLSA